MAGCGCSGGCSCYMVGGDSMDVTGNGSFSSPYTFNINLSKAGSTGCTDLMQQCVPGALERGLTYIPNVNPLLPGTVRLKISADPNNAAIIGSDSGLYVPAATHPPGLLCDAKVSALPATGALFARAGLGSNVMPQNLIRSVRAAVATGMRATILSVGGLADGTAVICPYPGFESNWVGDFCSVAPHDAAYTAVSGCTVSNYLPYPTYDYWDIGISQWKNLLVTCEDWFDNTTHNQWGGNTVLECLDEMAGQIVFCWLLTGETFTKGLEAHLLRAIKDTCTEQSTIVLSSQYDRLASFTAAGIATGAWIDSSANLAYNTPALLAGAAVGWAFVTSERSNAEILTYTGAGINTVVTKVSRRSQQARITGALAAVRGVASEDAMYYSGQARSMTKDPWPFQSMVAGQIHEEIDTATYRFRRRGFPYQHGWVMPPIPNATDKTRTLTLGWATPLPATVIDSTHNLQITWEQQFTTTVGIYPQAAGSPTPMPAAGFLGMMVMCDTDQAVADVTSGGTDPVHAFDPPSYYSCLMGIDGSMTVTGRYLSAAMTPPSATVSPGAFTAVAGFWYQMTIKVTSTSVIFTRSNGASSPSAVTYTHTVPTAALMRTGLPASRWLALRKTKGPAVGAGDFPGLYRNVAISVVP
jgi:hypothetical protein